jgi:hypothetical protein
MNFHMIVFTQYLIVFITLTARIIRGALTAVEKDISKYFSLKTTQQLVNPLPACHTKTDDFVGFQLPFISSLHALADHNHIKYIFF